MLRQANALVVLEQPLEEGQVDIVLQKARMVRKLHEQATTIEEAKKMEKREVGDIAHQIVHLNLDAANSISVKNREAN